MLEKDEREADGKTPLSLTHTHSLGRNRHTRRHQHIMTTVGLLLVTWASCDNTKQCNFNPLPQLLLNITFADYG